MRTWMQPSPKCPYGVPRSPWSAQQRAEVAQIGAEPGGRHRAVLPAGPGLAAVRRGRPDPAPSSHPPPVAVPARRPRAAATAPAARPGRRPPGRPAVRGPARSRPHARVPPPASRRPSPRTARRRPRGSPAAASHEVGGHALDGQRPVRQQTGGGLGRGALVGVAEHGQGPRAGRLDQPYDRLREHAAGCPRCRRRRGPRPRPSRAAARPGRTRRSGAGVPGSRCAAAPARSRPGPAGRPGAPGPSRPGGSAPLAACRRHVQLPHVVGGGAPGHRVRAAGVVADHPAEGAAAVGGGVGAEAQAVRGGGVLEPVEDDTGLDDGGTRVRVERDDPVHVAGEVQDDAGARGLPGDRGPAAARHHRHPVLAAHGERRAHVVRVAREGDHSGATRYCDASVQYSARRLARQSTPATPARRRASASSVVRSPTPPRRLRTGRASRAAGRRLRRRRVAGPQGRPLEPAFVGEDGAVVAGQLGVGDSRSRRASATRAQAGDVVTVAPVGALPGLRHALGRRGHRGGPADPEPAGELAGRGATVRAGRSGAVTPGGSPSGARSRRRSS